MKGSDALPVRTTFLHLLYPSVVPIFDKMVLKAVNMWRPGANTDPAVLEAYLPVAWSLADRYEDKLRVFPETPLRLVDMGLWVLRDSERSMHRRRLNRPVHLTVRYADHR